MPLLRSYSLDSIFNPCMKFEVVITSHNQNLGSRSQNINGYVILTTPHLGQFIIPSIVIAVINLHIKFEVVAYVALPVPKLDRGSHCLTLTLIRQNYRYAERNQFCNYCVVSSFVHYLSCLYCFIVVKVKPGT